MSDEESGPLQVIRRLHDAMNRRDLEAFASCFHEDYRSEQPVHPKRAFQGRGQVRKNWERIFENNQDFQAQILRQALVDNVVWTEWRWGGTRPDGQILAMAGVTLFAVERDRIVWGHYYMEPVEAGGGNGG